MKEEHKKGFNRAKAIDAFLWQPKFFTQSEIRFFIREFLNFLDDEEGHLINTGFPSTGFQYSYGPLGSWQNLYFNKIPFSSVVSGQLRHSFWREALEAKSYKSFRDEIQAIKSRSFSSYVWANLPAAILTTPPEVQQKASALSKHFVFARNKDSESLGYWKNKEGRLFTNEGKEVRTVPYSNAKSLQWITRDDERQIANVRPKLLVIKKRILNYASEYLEKTDKIQSLGSSRAVDRDFLETCAATMLDELDNRELDFCENLEGKYLSNAFSNYGGFYPIFRFIGSITAIGNAGADAIKTYRRISDRLSSYRMSEENDFPVYRLGEISDVELEELHKAYEKYIELRKAATYEAVAVIEKVITTTKQNKKEKSKKGRQKIISPIRKKADFKWSRVKISIDDESAADDFRSLLIEYDGKRRSLSHEQFGLFKKNTGGKNKAWEVLIGLIGSGGSLKTNQLRDDDQRLRQQILKIRVALKKIFNTNADPFESDTKYTGIYQVKFRVGSVAELSKLVAKGIERDRKLEEWESDPLNSGLEYYDDSDFG